MRNIKKRILAVVTALAMVLSLNTVAFVAPANTTSTELVDSAEFTNSARATNYGYSWYNAGGGRVGSFQVNGTGSRCGLTLGVEDFSSGTTVVIEVYYNGSLCCSTLSLNGRGLNTSSNPRMEIPSRYNNLPATTGAYTVYYRLIGTDSSGRVMAWTY